MVIGIDGRSGNLSSTILIEPVPGQAAWEDRSILPSRAGTASSACFEASHTGTHREPRLKAPAGLNLKLRIENYTSNRETKDFIVAQARMMAPDVREQSGVWYRLNRWREEQITSGKHPTYGDLVRQYVALNKMPRFERVPHGRYINFVADFLAADNGATRAEAIAAWNELKELDLPKDYVSWVKARANRKGKNR
jgi:hypothetical protein